METSERLVERNACMVHHDVAHIVRLPREVTRGPTAMMNYWTEIAVVLLLTV